MGNGPAGALTRIPVAIPTLVAIWAALAAATPCCASASFGVALYPSLSRTPSRSRALTCATRYLNANGHEGLHFRFTQGPRPAVRGLAYYTDGARRLPPVLSPKGWRCRADVYGDGSVLLVVSSRDVPEKDMSLRRLQNARSPLVAYYFSSVCTSCVFAVTCGAVRRQPAQGFGTCPQPAAAAQRTSTRRGVSRIGRRLTVVSFFDPRRVRGIGWPSGGSFVSLGAVAYEARPSPKASIVTCDLPVNLRRDCAAIRSSFVRQPWLLD